MTSMRQKKNDKYKIILPEFVPIRRAGVIHTKYIPCNKNKKRNKHKKNPKYDE
jgi:hypothetical protein